MTYENVYEAMLTTPIGPSEVILGEFIWVALKGGVMALGVGIFLALFGLMSNFGLLPAVALVGVVVALACGAIGLIATSYVGNINQFQSLYSFLIEPLYFFCPAFSLRSIRWRAPCESLRSSFRFSTGLASRSHCFGSARSRRCFSTTAESWSCRPRFFAPFLTGGSIRN